MTILTEYITVQWNKKNKEYYESKGYIWTRNGDYFDVPLNDVTRGTKQKIHIKCDYCGEEFSRHYSVWCKSDDTSPIKKDACKDCRGEKTRESNQLIYGVNNVMNLEENKFKLQETNIERYGVPSPLQNPKILAKVQETNIKKYGTPVPAKNKDVAEKTKKTNLERYGATNYLQSEVGLKRIKSIIKERWGVDHISQSKEIREKALKTLYANGTMSTSSQQNHIHALIKGELNYPFGRCSLDVAFPDDKIYLEYDGGGHNLSVKIGQVTQENFDKKERNRSFFLKDNGWREIRIISDKDKLPSDKTILDFVEIAKSFINANKWFSTHWNIDEDTVLVNYKHIYSLDEFFDKYNTREVI